MQRHTHSFQRLFPIWTLLPLLGFLFLAACEEDPEIVTDQPHIETLTLKDGQLDIQGDFGADPGADHRSVIIDDQPLASGKVTGWGESNIICSFDSELKDQIAVEVVSNGQKSNRKVLVLKSNLKITYLQVWEENSWLYIYGNFGPDPGAANRSVTVKGVPVLEIFTWAPNLITCRIPRLDKGAYGEVVVHRGPNESASRLLYRWDLEFKYSFPQAGLSGTLMEEAEFHTRIRGDVGEMPVHNGYIPNDDSQLFLFSYGTYKMSGSGHSTYDFCNQVDVTWEEVEGDLELVPNGQDHTGSTHFQGWITAARDGWDEDWLMEGYNLQFQLDVVNATTSHKTYTDCNGHSSTTIDPQMIDFVVFDNKTIPLHLSGTTLEAGSLEQYDVAPTSGLIWDAVNYPANLVKVTLSWKAAKAQW